MKNTQNIYIEYFHRIYVMCEGCIYLCGIFETCYNEGVADAGP